MDLQELKLAVQIWKTLCSEQFIYANDYYKNEKVGKLTCWRDIREQFISVHDIVFYVPKTKRFHYYREATKGTCMISIDIQSLIDCGILKGNVFRLEKDVHYKFKTVSQCKSYKEGITSMPLTGGSSFDYCCPLGARWSSVSINNFYNTYGNVPLYQF